MGGLNLGVRNVRASISPLEERHAVIKIVRTRSGVIGVFKLFRSPHSIGLISLFQPQRILLHSAFEYVCTASILTPIRCGLERKIRLKGTLESPSRSFSPRRSYSASSMLGFLRKNPKSS